tara:strand:+ start:10024 stop:11136 length:1113 start_codon:yes stop_codon:yes gene_type:complete
MSDKITFSELVKSFAEAHNITQQKADELIRGLFDIVLDDLEKDGKASITNFGSFELKEVAERMGINPQTKEEIVIPAHTKVSFKPYKALETTVNAPFAHLESKLLGDAPKKEEPPETTATTPQEDDFEDPFAEVITGSEENEESPMPEALETETPAEETATPPPVYKAPGKEQERSPVVMWILALLILFTISTGVWYFFLRDADGAYNNKEVAANQQTQTEQPTPPKENTEPVKEATQPAEKKPEPKNTATTKSSATTGVATNKAMTSYIVKKDEWLWDISRKVYGEPYLWPLIFEANKTVKDDPNLVETASTLMVPSLDGDALELTKADYARLAKASRKVSEAYGNTGNKERSAEYLRFSKKYERNSKN